MSSDREPFVRIVRTPRTPWRVVRAVTSFATSLALYLIVFRGDGLDNPWLIPLFILWSALAWWDTLRAGVTKLFKKTSGAND